MNGLFRLYRAVRLRVLQYITSLTGPTMRTLTYYARQSRPYLTAVSWRPDPEDLRLAVFLCAMCTIAALCVSPRATPPAAVSPQTLAEGPLITALHSATLIPQEKAPRTAAPDATATAGYKAPYDEPFVAHRWGLTAIDAPSAWAAGYVGESSVVAILDSGIDDAIPYLADRLVREANFTGSPTADDTYGHGTHTAGIVLAVAPQAALLNVKVADDRGNCEPSAVAKGIRWAALNGAHVINLSLSTGNCPQLEEAILFAHSKGALVVAAAGNGGGTVPSYPAFCEECIAVAALDKRARRTASSNHGDWVDMAAPGVDIYSASPRGQPGYPTGTSSAAAHVSGVAALAFPPARDLNGNGCVNDEVRKALEASCTSTEALPAPCGLVNALAAITHLSHGT